jgi:Fe-S cluster biogenesis protein NfuA
MTETKHDFNRRSERIEELVHRIEGSGDLATRAVAQELLQCVIELHGAALDRILSLVETLPQSGSAFDSMAQDELISGVLSLHGLHPIALEDRVATALENVRPYLHSHGGEVELQCIEGGVVRLRLRAASGGCASSAETMKHTVEDAIYNSAPEVSAVIAEHVFTTAGSELVTIRSSSNPEKQRESAWA